MVRRFVIYLHQHQNCSLSGHVATFHFLKINIFIKIHILEKYITILTSNTTFNWR